MLPRHEQGAGYAADGYARVTGRPGRRDHDDRAGADEHRRGGRAGASDSVPMLVISPGMPLRAPARLDRLPARDAEPAAGDGRDRRSQRARDEPCRAGARARRRVRGVRESRRPRARHIEIPLDLLVEAAPAEPCSRRTLDARRAAARRRSSPRPSGCARRAVPAIVAGGGAAGRCGGAGAARRAARRTRADDAPTARARCPRTIRSRSERG